MRTHFGGVAVSARDGGDEVDQNGWDERERGGELAERERRERARVRAEKVRAMSDGECETNERDIEMS